MSYNTERFFVRTPVVSVVNNLLLLLLACIDPVVDPRVSTAVRVQHNIQTHTLGCARCLPWLSSSCATTRMYRFALQEDDGVVIKVERARAFYLFIFFLFFPPRPRDDDAIVKRCCVYAICAAAVCTAHFTCPCAHDLCLPQRCGRQREATASFPRARVIIILYSIIP